MYRHRHAHPVGDGLDRLDGAGTDALHHHPRPRVQADRLGEVGGDLEALRLEGIGDHGNAPESEAGDSEGGDDRGRHEAAHMRAAVVVVLSHGVFR